MGRETAAQIAAAVAEDRAHRPPSFRPPGLKDVLDHWLSKAFGVLLLAALGGQGGNMLTSSGHSEHAHTLEDHIKEFERKSVVLDRGISANAAMRHELDLALKGLDQLAVIHLREKMADLSPSREMRMEYANRAERQYRQLVEDGMKRDEAIRRVAYRPID